MKYFYSDSQKVKKKFVGSKGYNLYLLKKQNLIIPKTCFISISAYEYFLNSNQIFDIIEDIINKSSYSEISNRSLELIQSKIINSPLPRKLWNALTSITAEFKKYSINSLAIRSSAVYEDLPNFSFAGQYKSIIDIKNEVDSITNAIKNVWASQWSEEIVTYSINNRLPLQKMGMGVIVQEFINADISGVLFTDNPINNDKNKALIEYVQGTAEKLVNGEVKPVQLFYDKTKQAFIDNENIDKNFENIFYRLIKDALNFSRLYGKASDFEWGVKNSQIFFLQYRAITTINKTIYWTDENVGEVIPDIVTPLTWSLLGNITNNSFIYFLSRLGVKAKEGITLFRIINGKVYFNKTAFEETISGLSLIKRLKSTLLLQEYGDLFIALYQTIKVMLYLLLLLFFLPFQIRFFLNGHFKKNNKLKTSVDVKKSTISNIDKILLIEQRNMNLHITVTLLSEIFYQSLKNIGKDWRIFTDDFSLDMLLQSSGNIESANSGAALWDLYKEFNKQPQTLSLLKNKKVQKIVAKLAIEYPDLYKKYQTFMEEFGHNAMHEFELLFPRWNEDDAYIIKTLVNYSSLTDDYSPYKSRELKKQQVQAKLKFVIKKLPLIKKVIFKLMFAWTKQFIAFRESLKQAFLKSHSLLKKNLLQLSQILDLKRKEDVFFLKTDEIKAFFAGNLGQREINEIIIKAKDKYKNNNDTFHAKTYFEINEQLYHNEESPHKENVLKLQGIGCSAGRVRGKARVINDPTKIFNFSKGDILIAKSTNPSWTPLFILAGGIATEIGGALSHASIIAREYGIPLVTAIPGLMNRIQDGEEIIVDGNRGFIYLDNYKENSE